MSHSVYSGPIIRVMTDARNLENSCLRIKNDDLSKEKILLAGSTNPTECNGRSSVFSRK